MSLYIPHIFPNFDQEYITGVFENLGYGCVQRVDLVSKIDKNGNNYNACYVHFSEWDNNVIVENFQARVADPEKEARIVHDDPWYWIILENKTKKHMPGDRKHCINITGDIQYDFQEDGEYNDNDKEIDDQDLYPDINLLQERNSCYLSQYLEEKDEMITILEHENEKLLLDLENERWEVMNVEMLNCELENEILEKKEQFEYANERGLHFAEKVSELQNELGDKEETLDFILKELKNAKDLTHLRESVRIFFQDMRQKEEDFAY